MPRSRKGQAIALDAVLALVIFLIVMSLFELTWLSALSRGASGAGEKEISGAAQNAANALFESPGYPEGWSTSDVQVLGLSRERGVVDNAKLADFLQLVDENYSDAKRLLGLSRYELYVRLSYPDGKVMGGYGLPPSADAGRVVTIRRIVLHYSTNLGLGKWPMFRGSALRDGVEDMTTTGVNAPWWIKVTGGAVRSPPAVVDGIVYAGSRDNNLYAVSAAGGSAVWNYATGDDVDAGPAVSRGRVYFGSTDGWFRALNATDGSPIWNVSIGAAIYSSPAVHEDEVFFGAGSSAYALNATTGGQLWTRALGGDVFSSPAVDGELIFIGSDDNMMHALWRENGSSAWNFTTGGDVRSSPAVADDMVIFASDDGKVYALDEATGAEVWSYSVGSTFGYSSPAVHGDAVFIGAGDGVMYALNETTGAHTWNYTTAGAIDSSPGVAGGYVIFGSNDGKLYGLNESTGSLLAAYNIGSAVRSSPALADGLTLVGDESGNLNCFGTNPSGFRLLNGNAMIVDIFVWR